MIDDSDMQPGGLNNLGFQKKIFSTSKMDFFFINKAYLNAYLQLLDGIGRPGGLFVLIGEAGVGKTFLLRKLTNEALETIRIVFCYSTNLDYDNLITLISDQLGISTSEKTHSNQFTALKDYLNQCPKQGIRVALLIDDAHHLGQEGLNHLIKWSSLELAEDHGLRIVLSGPPVLEEILNQVWRSSLATSVIPIHLEPLSSVDVATYMSRKIKSAYDLMDVDDLFLPSVIETIASYTGGIPRLINSLCEHALLITQLNGEKNISITSIKEAASELMLEEKISTEDATQFSEENFIEDKTLFVRKTQKKILDTNHFSAENRKKVIGSLLADLAEEPEKKHDNALKETVSIDSFDPNTTVFSGGTHPSSVNQFTQTTRLAARNEKSTDDHAGNRNLELTLVKEPVTTMPQVIQRDDFPSGRKGPEMVRTKRLPTALFMFSALLSGLIGGVGSIYLFRLIPEWIPESSSAKRETAAPAPAPTQAITAVAMPVSDSHEVSGATPEAVIESAAIDPEAVIESAASEISTPAPSSVSLESLTDLASAASPPSLDLALSPATTTPIIEVTPSVAKIETAAVSPPTSEQTTAKTPPVSSYMSSGDTLLGRGDVASARLFYEAAAAVGYAAAMTAVGKTYDPVMLNQMGIKGFRADPVKAAEWYLKAEKAGDPETVERLEELKRWMTDGSEWEETELNALRQLLR